MGGGGAGAGSGRMRGQTARLPPNAGLRRHHLAAVCGAAWIADSNHWGGGGGMKWPWQAAAEVKRQRDHALVRAVQLEARLRDVSEDRERVAAERRQAEEALARVVDNALF